jgi:hypothetical protein
MRSPLYALPAAPKSEGPKHVPKERVKPKAKQRNGA